MIGRGGAVFPGRPRAVLLVMTLSALGIAVTTAPQFGVAAQRWAGAVMLPALAWASYVWWRLGDGSDAPIGALGVANAVTVVRGFLVCSVAGFAVARPTSPWLPAVLFGIAVGLDAADGAIARRTVSTRLGARLDRSVDGLAILIGATAAVALGGLPAWYLTAGVVWYLYVAGLAVRARRGRPVYGLAPSRLRGPIGSVQYLVIAAGLTPVAPHAGLTMVAAVALVALLGSFLRDWLAATAAVGTPADRELAAHGGD